MNKMLFVSVLLFFGISSSNAQFVSRHNYLGPSIGFSFLGSTPQFGINYEYSMDLENFGLVGLGGVFRYWSYSEVNWSYTNVLIGVQGNYHFRVDNYLLDPWIGLTLAYDAGSVSWDGPSGQSYVEPTYGGVFLGVNLGARYWVSPKVGISGRIGFGSLSYGALELGVDFKF